ncbi:MAG: ABC transporter substrate-binding protein [Hydrogenophaga sp.]|nr:ABC transporter substrate-binding protein [Hydrogenophaga sp.]
MQRRWITRLVCFLVLGLVGFMATQARGQSVPIRIGMSLPLTGPAASFGEGLRHGAELAVARANAAGGVARRPLELVVLDDGGQVRQAESNALELVQRGVVALTGVHGAEAVAAVDAVLSARSSSATPPLVGPVTGDEALRTPPRPNLFFVRASITDEARAAMLHLDTLGITRYAVLAQDGPFGDAGLQSMLTELVRIAIRPVAVERLPANVSADNLRVILERACKQTPQVLILAMEASSVEIAVNAARSLRCAGQFLTFSEVGAAWASRQEALKAQHPMAGVLVTQVMPHPTNRANPLAAEYQDALKAAGARPGDYPSMEGYFAVRVIESALRLCGAEIGPACLRSTLESRPIELAGQSVRLGTSRRIELPFVDITQMTKEGRFRR